MDKHRIAWCITGSGHYLKESIDLMLTLNHVDLYLSKAGEEVLKWYDYDLDIFKKKKNTNVEKENVDVMQKKKD